MWSKRPYCEIVYPEECIRPVKLITEVIAKRPCIKINFGSKKQPFITSGLVDTGAIVSVINTKVAKQILTNNGRAYVLKDTNETLVTASGSELKVHGRLEVHIESIGNINFLVADSIHDVIIGWDYLNKFGFVLTEKELTWAGIPFEFTGNKTHQIDEH